MTIPSISHFNLPFEEMNEDQVGKDPTISPRNEIAEPTKKKFFANPGIQYKASWS